MITYTKDLFIANDQVIFKVKNEKSLKINLIAKSEMLMACWEK